MANSDPTSDYDSSNTENVFLRESSDSLTDVLEKLCNLTERMETLETTVESIIEVAEMNKKRHTNVDYSFKKLCPIIDLIFDTSDAPGHVQYDCCYESHSESGTHTVGQAMVCKLQSSLAQATDPEYPTTDRGVCADTCGDLPPQ